MAIRFRIEPRDVPPIAAARRLGLTEAEFQRALPDLLTRQFPPPDATTGNFDLDAIDLWRKQRHARLYGLAQNNGLRHAGDVVSDRLSRL